MAAPFLLGAGPGSAAQPVENGAAQDPFNFAGPEDDPEFGPLITGRPAPVRSVASGTSPPEEIATAFRLLFNAPRGAGQIQIARYFEAITQKNGGGELYNREWATRPNPLIVGLFSMTQTKPSNGDFTPWCAAFVSFCLYASGKQSAYSALSGSYRRYGTATTEPQPGDVVVFANYGQSGAQGHGHVGFYVGTENGAIRVLGGNQVGATRSTGAVVLTSFRRQDRSMELHSFRRVV
jgi:uncharacterized protein (TIGR02594 family)